jgi:hypothetical protein
MDVKNERRFVRLFWGLALIVGAIQTWHHRHAMQPDGMSYIDVADAYARWDWEMAINSYWSPLYSWIISVALAILKPSAYWEFTVAHGVNYLIFLWTMGCFHFFLRALIQHHRHHSANDSQYGVFHLPDWGVCALGYAIFLWTSNTLWSISYVTPDMLMGSFVFLACGVILRIRMGFSNLSSFVGSASFLALAISRRLQCFR